MKKILLTFILFASLDALAQTGVVRGRIIDNITEQPLEGVVIVCINDSTLNTVTDANGLYRLEKVPVGRVSLRMMYLGYENLTLPGIDVVTGKDVPADARLTESFSSHDEVVVTADASKDKPLNKMAAVSARQVSPEEISKYAGGRSDVARLAANFAGVSAPNDSRNDIVVRGNSPTGLLWRIEGIPVPNPNHFSTLGTTGSPVTALNVNVMGNSDFITSAFPAEYGNALGGVFDLNFRKGNTDKYEYTLAVGAFTGAEAMAEGPMGKGSFVGAVRYGLTGVLGGLGTSAVPTYSDISLNLDLGKTKIGNFSLFGIAGNSTIEIRGNEVDEDDIFGAKDENLKFASQFGVVGLKHTIPIKSSSSIKTTIGASYSGQTGNQERTFDFGTPLANTLPTSDVNNTETRYTLSSVFNTKYNQRTTLRAGILLEHYYLQANVTTRNRQLDNDGDGYADFVNILSTDDGYNVVQPYIQGQYRIIEKLTLNTGLHAQYFSVNEAFVAEPRVSLTWAIASAHSLTFGYGLHHQNVAAPQLFLNQNINGTMVQTNRDLELVRSNHYVLGYDLRPGKGWRAKVEAYYQDISNAAVEATPSGYSSLTEGASFTYSQDKFGLVSEGTGYNTGVELTLEKFLSSGWYALATASVFQAKYEGSDGIERNSPFNNGYVFNMLGGKEFKVGSKGRTVLFIDSRLSTAGGRYYTPVDLDASRAAGFEILQNDKAFSEQYDPYFRMDLKFGLKLNSLRRKISHQFYIDLQNVTNNKNVFVRQYNRITNNVDQVNQIGFFPDFGYKIQF